jgi:hypothetical protein
MSVRHKSQINDFSNRHLIRVSVNTSVRELRRKKDTSSCTLNTDMYSLPFTVLSRVLDEVHAGLV